MMIAMLYRPLIRRPLLPAALALTALLALPGCESQGQHHKTMKEEQYEKWNGARVGVLWQLAKQQYEVGDFDKCRETLAQGFSTGLPHAGLHVLAAKVDIEKGSLEPASEHLKQAIILNAQDPEPYYLLGVVNQRWQKNQAAHDNYQLALSKKPTEPLYLLAVVEMKISMGELDAAQKLLEDKLTYFEETAALRVALARLATLRGDQVAASKYLQQASLLSPDDLAIRQSYAESLFLVGRYADAARILEDLRKNLDVTNKNPILMLLGQSYLGLRRPRDARTCFAELTQANPNDTSAWLNLGKATLALNDYPQAISVARKILKTEPENISAMIVMALAQEKLKQPTDAQGTLLRAHEVAPQDATVLCLLGLNARTQGHAAQAADYFSKALEAKPKDKWAQELLDATTPPGHTADR